MKAATEELTNRPDGSEGLLRTADDVLERAAALVAETRRLIAEARRVREELRQTRCGLGSRMATGPSRMPGPVALAEAGRRGQAGDR